MDSKLIFTVCIFVFSFIVILLSTRMTLIFSSTAAFTLDQLTWDLWRSILIKKCTASQGFCAWLINFYSDAEYKWFSWNPLIVAMTVGPFIDAIQILFKKGIRSFYREGATNLVYGPITALIFVILPTLYIGVIQNGYSLGLGFYMYVVGSALIAALSILGRRYSSLTYGSDYQN